MSRQTPFDTGERLEAKPWYPDRSDPDTYGKVDFEDDDGETAFTVYIEKKGGDRVIHIYDHGVGAYAIDIDDRDERFELHDTWMEPAPPAGGTYIVPPTVNPAELDEHSDLL
jgi:hypothetical protein